MSHESYKVVDDRIKSWVDGENDDYDPVVHFIANVDPKKRQQSCNQKQTVC